MPGIEHLTASPPLWFGGIAAWLPLPHGLSLAATHVLQPGDIAVSLLIAVAFAGVWLGLANRKWIHRRGRPRSESGAEKPGGPTRGARLGNPGPALRLALENPYCTKGLDPELLVSFAAMASQESSGDPLDILLLQETSLSPIPPGWRLISYQPEILGTGRSEALFEEPDQGTVRVTKGDPLTILPLCASSETDVAGALEATRSFAASGYRSIAVARTGRAGNWHLLGVLPVREQITTSSRQSSRRVAG